MVKSEDVVITELKEIIDDLTTLKINNSNSKEVLLNKTISKIKILITLLAVNGVNCSGYSRRKFYQLGYKAGFNAREVKESIEGK